MLSSGRPPRHQTNRANTKTLPNPTGNSNEPTDRTEVTSPPDTMVRQSAKPHGTIHTAIAAPFCQRARATGSIAALPVRLITVCATMGLAFGSAAKRRVSIAATPTTTLSDQRRVRRAKPLAALAPQTPSGWRGRDGENVGCVAAVRYASIGKSVSNQRPRSMWPG